LYNALALKNIYDLQVEPSACAKVKDGRLCAREILNEGFTRGYLNDVSAILIDRLMEGVYHKAGICL
jgi:hypothetical protein